MHIPREQTEQRFQAKFCISSELGEHHYELLPSALELETNMKIKINNSNVLNSGSVVSRGNSTISFYPFDSTYEVKLSFFDEPKNALVNAEPRIDHISTGPMLYSISLYNWSQESGLGNVNPIYVANHLGSKIFLDLTCHTVGYGSNLNRILQYCFFDGGPVNG